MNDVFSKKVGDTINFTSSSNGSITIDLCILDGGIITDSINAQDIILNNFSIRESKLGNAIIFKQNDNVKMAINDRGVSISNNSITEGSKYGVLLLQSDNSGLILPRVSKAKEKMKKAPPGTIVYDKTNDRFIGMTKTGWKRLCSDNVSTVTVVETTKDVKPRPGTIVYNRSTHNLQLCSKRKWLNVV